MTTTPRRKIAINGFGRIGRCVAKQVVADDSLQLVAVNDLADDVDNLVYLYNYDSHYGRAEPKAERIGDTGRFDLAGDEVVFHNQAQVADVDWAEHGVDILIDASGVTDNVLGCRKLTESGTVAKAVITHSPSDGVDQYIIMGVNDDIYDPESHDVVSNTICDANAVAHALTALDEEYKVTRGMVTTLHPWLSFQNLVDGPVPWQARPGAYWSDFSLGRSSVNALIPKNTTVITALEPIMPELAKTVSAVSFRVPTQVVCAADLSIEIEKGTNPDDLRAYLTERFADSKYVSLNDESLVSTDFIGQPTSAVIDSRWIQVVDETLVKMILWYDNEWGYAARVIDLVKMMGSRL